MIEIILCILLGVLIGGALVFAILTIQANKNIDNAKNRAINIVEQAEREAIENKNAKLNEAKKEINELKNEANRDIEERKKIVQEAEDRAEKREVRLDQRSNNLDKREEALNQKESILETRKDQLDKKHSKIDELINEQEVRLYEIAALTNEEARNIILTRTEDEMAKEIAVIIKEEEQRLKDTVDKMAQTMLANTLAQYAGDATSDNTVSVVNLPSDEMKGRIIGREGRNIRAIESLTGVDLIIDDTPEAVVLSGFDPVRREIARKTIELLVTDGRIHPARIEEIVEKSRGLIEQEIREAGENALFELGIAKMHPDLIKLIGRMKYRTSYGQNVLKHSIEVAFFAGKLAAELGLDEQLARRAGLLHDLGKAVDHEIEGSHTEIGVEFATKYGERPEVINAIASHHGEVEATSIYSILTLAADKLSAARPGARRESVDSYLKRLSALEEISNSYEGVEKAYAIQAGREVRVVVYPDQVDDVKTHKIAKDIKERIEAELSYPGTIKVTVIRETRAVDVAK